MDGRPMKSRHRSDVGDARPALTGLAIRALRERDEDEEVDAGNFLRFPKRPPNVPNRHAVPSSEGEAAEGSQDEEGASQDFLANGHRSGAARLTPSARRDYFPRDGKVKAFSL